MTLNSCCLKGLAALMTCGALALPVVAQDAVSVIDPAVDINRDGFSNYPELQIVFPRIDAEAFTMMDTPGDGLLDEEEVRAAMEAGQWPETVD
jgi:hypothetical protein